MPRISRQNSRPVSEESSDPLFAADLERAMLAQASPADAAVLKHFFKTGKGQYGEGDRFLGIRNPATRRTAKAFAALPVSEAVRSARSPWHEIRLCSLLVLVNRYRDRRTDEREREEIFERYAALARDGFVNNWDLVDLTAPDIAGAYAFSRGVNELERFAVSGALWQERIAVVSMFPFIRAGEKDVPFRMVTRFLGHPHDLMHKACGWMLREIGKRDCDALTAYLMQYKGAMARTTLRYAIEHYPEPERQAFLAR